MGLREKHIEVLSGLARLCSDPANFCGPDKTTGDHLFFMIDEIKYNRHMPIDKIARWTGFIQGVLAARGIINVDEERDRTRPIFNRENR
jgi:hypothetical protein